MYVHVPIYAPMGYLWRSGNGSYGAAVEHLDDALGVLLDTLEELGIAEETLVIFSSDNGAPAGPLGGELERSVVSNGALRGGKGETWDGGMRVPCLAQWKGVIPAGAVCTELTTALDLLPTIASLAGVPMPEDRTIDGKDIAPLLLGTTGAVSPHDAFFYYGAGDHCLHAVRNGRWKLHLIRNELYDLETDIAESRDLFAQHPDVVAELRALADRCRHELGDASCGVEGRDCRAPGWVEEARTLTTMEELPPLLRALYD
jgi:arylsulfatase A-like enzyme